MGVLTETRSKSSLPVAGVFRLIDFPLTNCWLSGITDVWLMAQHNPHSLLDHVANGRPWDLDRTLGGFRVLHPFSGEDGERWHEGNAHAIHAHREFMADFGADVTVVLSSDHVYTLDFRDVVDAHLDEGASVTIVTTEVDRSEASRYGVVEVDGSSVKSFAYKPEDPATGTVAAEVFVYDAGVLRDALADLADEHGEDELGDFGERLLPRLVDDGRAHAHALEGYWRDLGTVESYWQGNQDLLSDEPRLHLDRHDWPIIGRRPDLPAAREQRGAEVADAMLSPGVVVKGSVERSVLGPGVVVERGARVVDSVLMEDVVVEGDARVERSVVSARVRVGEGAVVGAPGDGKLTRVGDGASVDAGSEVAAGSEVSVDLSH
jgi:glucose-1-phosphate adenylyltransferase